MSRMSWERFESQIRENLGTWGYMTTKQWEAIRAAEKDVADSIQYLIGKILIWEHTDKPHLIGREALVVHVVYDGNMGDISVLVRNRSKHGAQWNSPEKYYYNLSQFKEIK